MTKQQKKRADRVELNFKTMTTEQLIASFRHNTRPSQFNRTESGIPVPLQRITMGEFQTGGWQARPGR